MGQVTLRLAAKADLPVIVELWHELMAWHERLDASFTLQAGADSLFRDFVEQHLEGPDGEVFLAFVGREPAGYAMCRVERTPPVFIRDRVCLLQDLFVRDRFRRRGLGRRLTREVIGWGEQRGLDQVQLQVAALNETGIRFWEAMGFALHTHLMRLDLLE